MRLLLIATVIAVIALNNVDSELTAAESSVINLRDLRDYILFRNRRGQKNAVLMMDAGQLLESVRFCKNCVRGRVMSLFNSGSGWTGDNKNGPVNEGEDSSMLEPIMNRRNGFPRDKFAA